MGGQRPQGRSEKSQAWQLVGVPLTFGRAGTHPLSVVGARAARRGWAVVQDSAFPRGPGCPPPCPKLPPRGWQMLFHQPRRVGGLRKVLLGGSGGQWGRGQLLPSRGWLTAASEDPQLAVTGIGHDASRPSCLPPTAHRASALAPSHPWLRLQSPPGRQGRRHSTLRTAGAHAAKYLCELSETDRHVGNLVHVGLGEAAGWAAGRADWRGLPPGLLDPAEPWLLPGPARPGERD